MVATGRGRAKGSAILAAVGDVMRALVLSTAAFGAPGAAGSATVERDGVRYEDVARVGTDRVVLNGVGVRSVAWFKGYVAGLYLPRKASSAEQVYGLDGAKRIAVRMLVDVDSGVLAKTFSDGIRKNYDATAIAALQERMDAFDAEVRALGGVKKGDAIDLDYRPSDGTSLRVNGKSRGDAIAGDDFYVALLKMFIGERAVDKTLRAALLGQATPAGSAGPAVEVRVRTPKVDAVSAPEAAASDH